MRISRFTMAFHDSRGLQERLLRVSRGPSRVFHEGLHRSFREASMSLIEVSEDFRGLLEGFRGVSWGC